MKEKYGLSQTKTELITDRPALQEMLRRALQVESAQKMKVHNSDYDDRKVTLCNNMFNILI